MHLLFEEEGDLKVGAVLSSTDTSFQVELPGGKRTKIKSGHVLLRFERPAGAMLLEQARREAGALDVDFLWQCAPQQEFGFQELAREYFGREPAAVEAAAILMRLHSAPVYFHRKGKGRFRPAPPDVLQAALAAVAKRREQDERRASHVAEPLPGRAAAVEAGQELARVPGRRASRTRVQDDRAAAVAGARIDRLALCLASGEFPGALFSTRHRLCSAAGRSAAARCGACAGPGPGVFDRRQFDHGDRRCVFGLTDG